MAHLLFLNLVANFSTNHIRLPKEKRMIVERELPPTIVYPTENMTFLRTSAEQQNDDWLTNVATSDANASLNTIHYKELEIEETQVKRHNDVH